MKDKPDEPQAATIKLQLGAAKRPSQGAPVRNSFVQGGSQREPTPGPLAKIVRSQDDTALDLFLLHRALATAFPWDVVRHGRIWGRMLGHHTDKDGGTSIVSKAWARLDTKYNLVKRERSGRLARITALDESGTRDVYDSPSTGYFRLPFAYWLDDSAHYFTLSLPAKAALLISLSLKPGFKLPAERGPDWYGISADTLGRGLKELDEKGILKRHFESVVDWNSPIGSRTDVTHWLQSPYRRRRTGDANMFEILDPETGLLALSATAHSEDPK